MENSAMGVKNKIIHAFYTILSIMKLFHKFARFLMMKITYSNINSSIRIVII